MLSSGVCKPSLSISIHGTFEPFIMVISSIFCTLPETLEWIGAEMYPSASAIRVPTLTSSPRLTTGFAGLPMCIDIGIATVFGGSSRTGGSCAVFFLCGT